jgi:hypothetical protein
MSDTAKPPRWVLVARNLLIARGVFESKQACWDFADQRGLPRDAMDTIPLGYVHLEWTPEQDELTHRRVMAGPQGEGRRGITAVSAFAGSSNAAARRRLRSISAAEP